jgi:farnesol dehydrogenase
MNLLVTGGTGFLGKAVVRHLLRAGHHVRLLVREVKGELPEGVETVRGDVAVPESVAEASRGCDGIFHMAALVKVWVPDRKAFDRVNVGGIRNVLAAAEREGARLVYTSTFMALGPSGPRRQDETLRHPGPPYRNDYERTKVEADRIAREAVATGQDVVLLYPGVIYGPGDLTEGNIVVRMLIDHLSGRFPGFVGAGDRLWSYAFVEDVARGHLLAWEKGRKGEGYLLCGENKTLLELFQLLEKLTGVAPPKRHIPYGVSASLGRILWLWAELTGHPPLLTHEVVNVFREHWAYSSFKAGEELGYASRPLDEGLQETVSWLRESNLV